MFLFFCFFSFTYLNSADKRAAWRQARLKELEDDKARADEQIKHDISAELTDKKEVIISYNWLIHFKLLKKEWFNILIEKRKFSRKPKAITKRLLI